MDLDKSCQLNMRRFCIDLALKKKCEKQSKEKTIQFKTFSVFFLINIYFFNFQFCALIIGFVTTGLTISSLLLYVIPETYYKAFYALWVCSFYVSFSGIYSIMAPVIQTTFGQLNYSRDYGLVFTQSVSTSDLKKIWNLTFLLKHVSLIYN